MSITQYRKLDTKAARLREEINGIRGDVLDVWLEETAGKEARPTDVVDQYWVSHYGDVCPYKQEIIKKVRRPKSPINNEGLKRRGVIVHKEVPADTYTRLMGKFKSKDDPKPSSPPIVIQRWPELLQNCHCGKLAKYCTCPRNMSKNLMTDAESAEYREKLLLKQNHKLQNPLSPERDDGLTSTEYRAMQRIHEVMERAARGHIVFEKEFTRGSAKIDSSFLTAHPSHDKPPLPARVEVSKYGSSYDNKGESKYGGKSAPQGRQYFPDGGASMFSDQVDSSYNSSSPRGSETSPHRLPQIASALTEETSSREEFNSEYWSGTVEGYHDIRAIAKQDDNRSGSICSMSGFESPFNDTNIVSLSPYAQSLSNPIPRHHGHSSAPANLQTDSAAGRMPTEEMQRTSTQFPKVHSSSPYSRPFPVHTSDNEYLQIDVSQYSRPTTPSGGGVSITEFPPMPSFADLGSEWARVTLHDMAMSVPPLRDGLDRMMMAPSVFFDSDRVDISSPLFEYQGDRSGGGGVGMPAKLSVKKDGEGSRISNPASPRSPNSPTMENPILKSVQEARVELLQTQRIMLQEALKEVEDQLHVQAAAAAFVIDDNLQEGGLVIGDTSASVEEGASVMFRSSFGVGELNIGLEGGSSVTGQSMGHAPATATATAAAKKGNPYRAATPHIKQYAAISPRSPRYRHPPPSTSTAPATTVAAAVDGLEGESYYMHIQTELSRHESTRADCREGSFHSYAFEQQRQHEKQQSQPGQLEQNFATVPSSSSRQVHISIDTNQPAKSTHKSLIDLDGYGESPTNVGVDDRDRGVGVQTAAKDGTLAESPRQVDPYPRSLAHDSRELKSAVVPVDAMASKAVRFVQAEFDNNIDLTEDSKLNTSPRSSSHAGTPAPSHPGTPALSTSTSTSPSAKTTAGSGSMSAEEKAHTNKNKRSTPPTPESPLNSASIFPRKNVIVSAHIGTASPSSAKETGASPRRRGPRDLKGPKSPKSAESDTTHAISSLNVYNELANTVAESFLAEEGRGGRSGSSPRRKDGDMIELGKGLGSNGSIAVSALKRTEPQRPPSPGVHLAPKDLTPRGPTRKHIVLDSHRALQKAAVAGSSGGTRVVDYLEDAAAAAAAAAASEFLNKGGEQLHQWPALGSSQTLDVHGVAVVSRAVVKYALSAVFTQLKLAGNPLLHRYHEPADIYEGIDDTADSTSSGGGNIRTPSIESEPVGTGSSGLTGFPDAVGKRVRSPSTQGKKEQQQSHEENQQQQGQDEKQQDWAADVGPLLEQQSAAVDAMGCVDRAADKNGAVGNKPVMKTVRVDSEHVAACIVSDGDIPGANQEITSGRGQQSSIIGDRGGDGGAEGCSSGGGGRGSGTAANVIENEEMKINELKREKLALLQKIKSSFGTRKSEPSAAINSSVALTPSTAISSANQSNLTAILSPNSQQATPTTAAAAITATQAAEASQTRPKNTQDATSTTVRQPKHAIPLGAPSFLDALKAKRGDLKAAKSLSPSESRESLLPEPQKSEAETQAEEAAKMRETIAAQRLEVEKENRWRRLCGLMESMECGVQADSIKVGELLGRGKFAAVYSGLYLPQRRSQLILGTESRDSYSVGAIVSGGTHGGSEVEISGKVGNETLSEAGTSARRVVAIKIAQFVGQDNVGTASFASPRVRLGESDGAGTGAAPSVGISALDTTSMPTTSNERNSSGSNGSGEKVTTTVDRNRQPRVEGLMISLVESAAVATTDASIPLRATSSSSPFSSSYSATPNTKTQLNQISPTAAVLEAAGARNSPSWRPPDATVVEFLRELQALQALDPHPNIVHLEAAVPKPLCLLLEKMDSSLADMLDKPHWQERTHMRARVLLLLDIGAGLGYMHSRGFVHRDIKPHNILLATANDVTVAKVGDLGTAVPLQSEDELLVEPCGTSGYTAPEVLSGVGYGKSADVYSFAVLAWELFSHNHLGNPLKGLDPLVAVEQIEMDIRPPFDSGHLEPIRHLISQAWQSEPSKRPQMVGLLSNL